ncbi:hypothetical protein LCGC14_1666090 [marine sediment metagenome]|uniref:ABC3 transporter permease protein domain-containing protein n=1 Tax=marine sediment metagenome TaxID=412755 RepID=A0A0F9HTB6_9ZZZZ
MRFSDILRFSGKTLTSRKKQTALTALGILIGIAAIISLLSMSEGFKANIDEQFQENFSTDTLIVTTLQGFMRRDPAIESIDLYLNNTINFESIEHVEIIMPVIQKQCSIEGLDGSHTIYGLNFEKYAAIFPTFSEEFGIIPTDENSTEFVIGFNYYNPWDNGTTLYNVGDNITITWRNSVFSPVEQYKSNISAILYKIGGGAATFGSPSDDGIYIQLNTAIDIFDTEEVNRFIIKLNDDSDAVINQVIAEINTLFPNQLNIISPDQILAALTSTFDTINLFLTGVAAISLIVAGIGIMNIMTVSLMQRKREIGIMKALGMKDTSVLSIFLIEAMLIGLIGSVLGVLTGWIFASLFGSSIMGNLTMFQGPTRGGAVSSTTILTSITPVITPLMIVGAIFFGLAVAIVFGLYPAYKSSRLSPVKALRYE